MSMRSKFLASMAATLTAAAVLPACDGGPRLEGPTTAKLEIQRTDAARNRLWVLGQDAITVYDAANGRRLRSILLPDWVIAGKRGGCPRDLALDGTGTAFVSSSVLPVLWRIEPEQFKLTRLELYPSVRDACDPATLLRASQEQTSPVTVASQPR